MNNIIEVNNLAHCYGERVIYESLDFSVAEGKVFGLLGKNGVGKTTLIKILMGFLRPASGTCRIFGEDSHNLSPESRANIGLLFEGHLAYEFMTIEQIEKFYAPYYPKWNRDCYYDLVKRLGLPYTHKISDMSCGQRSQVVLGLIMAQQSKLLILDDYSMGLDAGYRRLFLDYMAEYLKGSNRTVFLTSHIIQDMVGFVDEVMFLERGGLVTTTSLQEFQTDFHCYRLPKNSNENIPSSGEIIKNVEVHATYHELFSFKQREEVVGALEREGFESSGLEHFAMNLEDAFIGFTGRY